MTLTKSELADLLFEKVGLNKREAKDMVEAFFDEVKTALEEGDDVKEDEDEGEEDEEEGEGEEEDEEEEERKEDMMRLLKGGN